MATNEADVDGILSFTAIGNLGGFQTFDGAEEGGEVVEDRAPGALYADKDVTNPSLTNIVLTRRWNEARDRPLYNQMKGKTNTPGTAGRVVRDEARNISNVEPFTVKLVRFSGPKGDTNSNAKAMFTIEVAVTGRG